MARGMGRGGKLRTLAPRGMRPSLNRAISLSNQPEVLADRAATVPAPGPSLESFAYRRSTVSKRYRTKQFGLLEIPALKIRGPVCLLESEATKAILLLYFNLGKAPE